MKKFMYLLMFIITLHIASAAILHGSIYDSKLNRLNNVVVEVNSSSPQVFVSKEGQYSFVLEPGDYNIHATYQISGSNYLYTEHNLTITKDSYIQKDLLLRPVQNKDMPTGAAIGAGGLVSYSILISIAAVILIIILGVTVYKFKFATPEVKPEPISQNNDILKILDEEGGRTTQKEIRKKIPLSEAKISLMISELENDGVLKRIKKGRGNVIILNKK
ncbi:MAG: winged helix-turn-helix transcriptional regulator [Nanoarchaeota archaeon]